MASKIERRQEGRRLLTEDREHRWRGAPRGQHRTSVPLCSLCFCHRSPLAALITAPILLFLFWACMRPYAISYSRLILIWSYFNIGHMKGVLSSETRDKGYFYSKRGQRCMVIRQTQTTIRRGNMHACRVCGTYGLAT
jgi:hypothetical protein